MNAKSYFLNVVVPLVERHLAEPKAIDLNFAAVIATYHVVDYLAVEQSREPSDLRKEIEVDCPEFNALYAIATARKHAVVGRVSSHQGLSADTTVKNSPLPVGGKFIFSRGRMMAEAPKVTSAGGKKVYVHIALEKSVAYFKVRFA